MTEPTAKPTIVHRDIDFGIDDTLPRHWLAGCPHRTHFMNALSVTFPEGERFFIRSVHRFAKRIKDPQLQAEVRAFTQQEAMHGREHQAMNDVLARQGYPVKQIEEREKREIAATEKYTPAIFRLAVTACLEHYTALMAEVVLTDDKLINQADARMQKLWRWHAVEESEHKAVAFDVYATVMGKSFNSWWIRSFAMVQVTLHFWLNIFIFHLMFIKADKQLWNIKGWLRAWWFLWGKPGPVRRVIPGVLAWFKPGFHPSQRDTRALMVKGLQQLEL